MGIKEHLNTPYGSFFVHDKGRYHSLLGSASYWRWKRADMGTHSGDWLVTLPYIILR